MQIENWFVHAKQDADRQDNLELQSLLEMLRVATSLLHDADWCTQVELQPSDPERHVATNETEQT